ncbi:cysteine proteinase [Massarina eburnea CBS 473.64]|uniref:Cysteine proteinase n=1 Tax=Massarina eburnea CBS 473.64 TaxID=1395130 RepID=A0A6A6RTC7_9PLEO|nr:cysteine proteinase [Massarina eburnea CBS 473.64]
MNGYHGAEGWRGSEGAANPSGPAPYPPIAEITANADERIHELKQAPIGRILESAKHHFRESKAMLANRSPPAGAYWAYIVAYSLVVVEIPKHRDYYDKICNTRGQMYRDFTQLLKDVQSNEERFTRIKEIIVLDNKRNATVQLASTSRPTSFSSSRGSIASDSSSNPRLSNGFIKRDDELMLPSVPAGPPLGRTSPADLSDAARRKPPVQPKPQSMHGRAMHQSSSSVNGAGVPDLAERFAKLRGISTPIDTGSARSSQDLSVKMPSPSDYNTTRPLGPREMPRLPLNTQYAASLPKEPSPTYSPARNLSLPAHINPPRSSARSIVGTGGRSNSMASSSASGYAPNGHPDSYFPPQQSGDAVVGRTSTSKPVELQITAERLYDYVRTYNVLLIDVRDRASFDHGHIYALQVICVEPTSLADGLSAEQLHDRLVLSPDEELALFDRRHEFDLVVYHDEETKTNGFIKKYNPDAYELALQRLFITLNEFNSEKPLKRPPIFLMGGIVAWLDLVGPHSLKMSQTLEVVTGGKPRSRPPRRPAPGYAARALQNRRQREYNPIEPEEQQQWLEKIRRERSVMERPTEEDEDATSPIYHTTEDFLRRYPDVEDQQSMMYPPSRSQPPVQYTPAPIPAAPSRPPPSVPRVSYSGVHEREVARQTNGNQPPAYVSPGRPVSVRLHRTGLGNLGVTCYLNSVIQCLSANPDLTSLFLSRRYSQDVQEDNFKGTRGVLAEAYYSLLTNLYKGDVSYVRPKTFRFLCGRFNSMWQLDQQQDAKEFLEFILDSLHEDLNTTYNKTPLKTLTESEEQAREQLPRQYAAKIEWNRYQHRDMSLIGNLFAGQHASTLTCTTCGLTSTTYEAFWSISVEINPDRACDVRDCLRSYCSTERLDLDDAWRCPRCKVNREADKKITITRAPETLVIHFKRFSASRTQNARKIHSPIHFPLQGLDMGPYMEKPLTAEQEAYVLRTAREPHNQLATLKTEPAMNGPYMYNAYAVIRHIGSSGGSGHYTALAKDRSKGCWREFNDDRIRDFEPANLPESERLQNERAYVVFYERERVAGGI